MVTLVGIKILLWARRIVLLLTLLFAVSLSAVFVFWIHIPPVYLRRYLSNSFAFQDIASEQCESEVLEGTRCDK